MSILSVNTVSPRTTDHVEITGLNPPTYLSEELALKSETLLKAGGTMTGALVLAADGAAALNPVSKQQMEARLVELDNRNVGSSGYQSFPKPSGGNDPIVMQWKTVNVASPPAGFPGQTGSVTWQVPFANACITVQTTIHITAGNPANLVAAITSMSTTGCTFDVQEWSAETNPCVVHFLAIGY